MGKTPREFGSVHVHFEGFHVVDGRRCVALVLAQAALLPCEGATVTVLDGDIAVASAELPPLGDGRVVRVKLSCVLRAPAESLTLRVEAKAPRSSARRVRPAWKLHDTFEIPRLSEMDPIRSDGDLALLSSAALAAVAGPLSGAVVLRIGSTTVIAGNDTTQVHRAVELPPLAAGRLEGVARPVEAVEHDVVWQAGDPVPAAAPPIAQVQARPPPPATRWCRTCGFEGPAAEYERARSCPRCDEPWF